MSKLKFSDGKEFDTSGHLRVEQHEDGWYVLGEGHLIPVKDLEEGRAIMSNFRPEVIKQQTK